MAFFWGEGSRGGGRCPGVVGVIQAGGGVDGQEVRVGLGCDHKKLYNTQFRGHRLRNGYGIFLFYFFGGYGGSGVGEGSRGRERSRGRGVDGQGVRVGLGCDHKNFKVLA